MARGLVSGFAEGYGLVSGIQNQQAQRERDAQRYEDEKAFRQQQLDMTREQVQYERGRDEVADERWQQQFEADQAQRDRQYGLDRARLGISAQKARTSARRNDLAARQQEIELAQMQREQREQQNRRYLEAAGQELETNGVTPRFRELSKQAGINVDKLVDPKFRQSQQVLIAGLQGAPIEKSKMIDAADTFFSDRIDRVIGSQTQDGRDIVRAKLDNFFPGPDGESVTLDLKIWARDKNGNVEEYNAPVTSNRSADDEYVLTVPMDQALGHIKGMDLLDKAVDKNQLRSLIKQQNTLLGGGGSDSSAYWLRGPGNTIINRQTGESKTVPQTGDDKKRYSDALKYAQNDAEKANEFGQLDQLSDEERRRWVREKRDMYLDLMTPEETIEQPDAAVIRKLEDEGGSFIAPGGKYAGREVRLNDDGTVVVR